MKKIIIYDFDGTLTPYPMPKLEILEKCGLKEGTGNPDFLNKAYLKSKQENMDLYKSFYLTSLEVLKENNIEPNNINLTLGSDKVKYNKGVIDFLKENKEKRINSYLLSSGMKIYLEKTKVAKYFTDIYATTFLYEKNKIVNVAFLMTDKNKVVALREILKKNNKKDCKDIIYIGDGLSDYYVMKYVKEHAGTTILLYLDNKEEAISMQEKGVLSYMLYNDFSKDSDFYKQMVSLLLNKK